MNARHEHGKPVNPSATLASLRAEALGWLRQVPAQQRDTATALPYLSFIRIAHPTEMGRGMLEPSLCLVLQGSKKILIGDQITHYGVGSYVLSAIDLPVSGQVLDATPEAPYLGLRIALDPKEIAGLIVEMNIAPPPNVKSGACAYVAASTTELQDALLRLVRLLHTPRDLAALSRLVKQEVLYRLLTEDGGGVLYQSLLAHTPARGVNEAIHWIKQNYARPLKIDELAKAVSMSASTLHHRFKAATVMSPLQYQKQVRLLEARRLLLTGKLEAATVAFQVGYESPSQFSREYRRLFGAAPLRDRESLMQHELAP